MDRPVRINTSKAQIARYIMAGLPRIGGNVEVPADQFALVLWVESGGDNTVTGIAMAFDIGIATASALVDRTVSSGRLMQVHSFDHRQRCVALGPKALVERNRSRGGAVTKHKRRSVKYSGGPLRQVVERRDDGTELLACDHVWKRGRHKTHPPSTSRRCTKCKETP